MNSRKLSLGQQISLEFLGVSNTSRVHSHLQILCHGPSLGVRKETGTSASRWCWGAGSDLLPLQCRHNTLPTSQTLLQMKQQP